MHALFGNSAPYGLGSSLRLWLDARTLLGRASGAAITAPSDLQNAAWQKVNSSASSATQLTDTSDSGVPKVHMVVQYATNATVGTSFVFVALLKQGTKTWARIALGSNSGAYVNLSTGALGGVTNATCTVTDAGGGWWRVELTARPLSENAGCVVALANGDGAQSYAGDGTGTVFATSMAVYQQLVSSWPDWSGQDSHLDEVSTNKPIWTPNALDGSRPGVIFSASQSEWLGRGAGGVSAIIDGEDKPFSMIVVARRDLGFPDAGGLACWDHTSYAAGNFCEWYMAAGSTDMVVLKRDAATNQDGNSFVAGFSTTAPEIFQLVCPGTTFSVWRTNTAISLGSSINVGTAAYNIFTLGGLRRGGTPAFFGNWTYSEVRIWNEALSEAVRLRELAVLKLKWGIA